MGISLGNHTTVLSAINATTVDCSFFAVETSNLISAADSPFPPNEVQYLVLTDGISRKTAVGIRYAAGYPQIATRGVTDGNWLDDDWLYFSTATPPQEFDLPLASGFTNADVGIKSRYSKDQMGQVFVDLAVSGSINANTITTIATLPEGFRPSYIAHSVAYRYTGQLPSIGLWVSVDGTVSCFSPESIEGLAGQILFIAAS